MTHHLSSKVTNILDDQMTFVGLGCWTHTYKPMSLETHEHIRVFVINVGGWVAVRSNAFKTRLQRNSYVYVPRQVAILHLMC
jgi:hypothetical protein